MQHYHYTTSHVHGPIVIRLIRSEPTLERVDRQFPLKLRYFVSYTCAVQRCEPSLDEPNTLSDYFPSFCSELRLLAGISSDGAPLPWRSLKASRLWPCTTSLHLPFFSAANPPYSRKYDVIPVAMSRRCIRRRRAAFFAHFVPPRNIVLFKPFLK